MGAYERSLLAVQHRKERPLDGHRFLIYSVGDHIVLDLGRQVLQRGASKEAFAEGGHSRPSAAEARMQTAPDTCRTQICRDTVHLNLR